MNGDELIKLVPKWAKKIGHRQAKRKLVIEDVGISTADLMVRGEYYSSPGVDMVNKLQLAMKDFLAELAAS